MATPAPQTFVLDGATLEPEDLFLLGDANTRIALSPDAWAAVKAGRRVVDDILAKGEVAYGINTGFGLFSRVVIAPDKLTELQENLIRSHASGVGAPLSPQRTRRLLALRVNVLAKGHSGIRVETLERVIAAFNGNCLSVVPCKGTVGASGDLAPLAHLALGLMGEGDMWDPAGGGGAFLPAREALASRGCRPISLGAKEGLALINGTQMITAVGAEAVVRAATVAKTADVACALTLEVLKGTARTTKQHSVSIIRSTSAFFIIVVDSHRYHCVALQ